MHELNQEVLFRKAKRDHQRLLLQSAELRMIESAKPYTPNIWDTVELILGNWLISLGSKIKARSVYTKLSRKQV